MIRGRLGEPIRIGLLAAASAAAAVAQASGDGPVVRPDRVVSAADPGPWDVLGYGIALEGTTMLVGARGVDVPSSNGGAVYAFRRVSGQWVQVQKLTFVGASTNSQIGTSVAVSATVGVAGAPRRGAGGSAFVLRFSGGAWFSQVELADPSAGSGSAFGSAVACSEDVVVAAAPNSAEGVGAGAGRVRVFDRSGQTWTPGQAITAPYPDPGDRFGDAVALSGTLLAIGSPGDDDWAINSGAVYLFERSGPGYQLRAKLRAPTPQAEAWFGSSVALRGNTLVVGAPYEDRGAPDSGCAYVYRVDVPAAPVLGRVLAPALPAETLNFGFSLATDGTSIAVGSPGLAVEDVVVGGAWLYLNDDSVADAVLRPSGPPSLSLAGVSVAISDAAAFTGCPGMQVGFAPSAGATLLLDRTRDCNSNGVTDAIEVATGAAPDADGDGVPDACQCRADLFVDGFVNGVDLGVLLSQWGPAPAARPSDFNRDGFVNADDLGFLLGSWGTCPAQ